MPLFSSKPHQELICHHYSGEGRKLDSLIRIIARRCLGKS